MTPELAGAAPDSGPPATAVAMEVDESSEKQPATSENRLRTNSRASVHRNLSHKSSSGLRKLSSSIYGTTPWDHSSCLKLFEEDAFGTTEDGSSLTRVEHVKEIGKFLFEVRLRSAAYMPRSCLSPCVSGLGVARRSCWRCQLRLRAVSSRPPLAPLHCTVRGSLSTLTRCVCVCVVFGLATVLYVFFVGD